ncbi:MAG TPA: FAD-binding oxidoreductase [Vicinamibacterales bacterium]|nr:FAD-binding oxidoreductase [Vicinamibacterales bacterium]
MTVAAEKFFQARIVQRAEFADDLWMIRVDPGVPFSFTAGQYATLGVQTEKGLIERAYSIVSSPHEQELEFFFELVPQGELTPLLYKLGPGDLVTSRKVAKGRFTLDTTSGRHKHFLLCTVTGIAPFVSYARTLFDDWQAGRFAGDHELFVVHGASRSREFGYREEMERIAASVPWLTYVPTISRPWDDPDWKRETGRVDELIRKYGDQWSLDGETTTAYLCGHPEMVEHGKAILKRRGWKKDGMKEEIYFIPKHAAGEA